MRLASVLLLVGLVGCATGDEPAVVDSDATGGDEVVDTDPVETDRPAETDVAPIDTDVVDTDTDPVESDLPDTDVVDSDTGTLPTTLSFTVAIVPADPDTTVPLTYVTTGLPGRATVVASWRSDNLAQPSYRTTVPASVTERGQVWTLSLAASLPNGAAAAVAAPQVTIGNAAPVATAALGLVEGGDCDLVRCTVSATDADLDPLVVTYAFTVDGVPAADTIEGTLDVGPIAGALVACEATVTDGHGGTTIALASRTQADERDVVDADQDGLCDAVDRCFGDQDSGDHDADDVCDDLDQCIGDDATGDADGDRLCDDRERILGTDPASPDFDGDRLVDGEEVALGTNPKQTDSDHDGIDDGDEVDAGLDPTDADTDGGGIGDGVEQIRGTDPLDALDDPLRVFVTTGTVDGHVGSLRTADAICQAEADGALLGGSWVAWLSTTRSYAGPRIDAGPRSRLDGVRIADSKDDLLDGTLLDAILIASDGQPVTAGTRAWTGSSDLGLFEGGTCDDWSTASELLSGNVGDPGVASGWSGSGLASCDQARRLYCFEATPSLP